MLCILVVPERKKSIQKILKKRSTLMCVCMALYQDLIVQVISIRNSISLANAILCVNRLRSPTFILEAGRHIHTSSYTENEPY